MLDFIIKTKCETCSGSLKLDRIRHICVCESCGNEYDYEYFYSEDLLSEANKELGKKNYTKAADMYGFYLLNNEDSKDAKKGKILSILNISSMSMFKAEDYLTNKVDPNLEELNSIADANMVKFLNFDKVNRKLSQDAVKANIEIKRLKAEKKKREENVAIDASEYRVETEAADEKKNGLKLLLGVLVIGSIPLMALTSSAIVSVISLIVDAVIIYFLYLLFKRMKDVARNTATNRTNLANERLKEIESEIAKNKSEYDLVIEKINKNIVSMRELYNE